MRAYDLHDMLRVVQPDTEILVRLADGSLLHVATCEISAGGTEQDSVTLHCNQESSIALLATGSIIGARIEGGGMPDPDAAWRASQQDPDSGER